MPWLVDRERRRIEYGGRNIAGRVLERTEGRRERKCNQSGKN